LKEPLAKFRRFLAELAKRPILNLKEPLAKSRRFLTGLAKRPLLNLEGGSSEIPLLFDGTG
jgi:hypothetical protein